MQCLSIDRIDPKRKNIDWYYRQYDIFPAFLQNNVCTEIQLFCRFWFLLQALKMEQIKESLLLEFAAVVHWELLPTIFHDYEAEEYAHVLVSS